MAAASDKKYRLKIRRDGVVRYLMSDGSFWEPRNCPHLTIHEFQSRTDAELVTKIFNSPEIEAAIICGRSVDSAIQDYLERHSLEEVKR